MKISVKIQGLTPLLMHRFSDESYNAGKQNKDLTPRELAEPYAYRLKNGELYIPIDAMMSAMKYGGKFHTVGKNKVTTNKSSLVPAGITMLDLYMKLGAKDFEVDSRPVTNNALGGAKIISHRPRIDKWETNFQMDVDDLIFKDSKMGTEARVRAIVDDAGKKAGLLSFRPSCGGIFGKFIVIKWKVEK